MTSLPIDPAAGGRTTAAAAPAPSPPRGAGGLPGQASKAPARAGTPLAPEIWACPDCGDDLEEDAFAMWCGRCQAIVPYAVIYGHPESEDL